MKITKNLVHIATEVQLEAAMTEEALAAEFEKHGLKGFSAELDIAERTEEHVQMAKLEDLLGFAAASGAAAVTYDVTYFPQADGAEVDRQVALLARDLEIDEAVIRELCEEQIAEYLKLDAERDASVPVHSIVEAYVGGTAFAWYGMNDYPRLRRVILRELAQGGAKAKRAFVLRASKAQVDLLEDF